MPDWCPIGGNDGVLRIGNAQLVRSAGGHAVMVDIGAQFAPPDCGGAVQVMPDVRAALEGDPRPEALFVSHAHPDHYAGIPHCIRMGLTIPPIHTAPFTIETIRQCLSEAGIPPTDWPQFVPVRPRQRLEFGDLVVEPLAVSHAVPQALGFIYEDGEGRILHSCDIKTDMSLLSGPTNDFRRMLDLGNEGVDLLILHSQMSWAGPADGPDKALDADMIDPDDEMFGRASENEADKRREIAALLEKHAGQRVIVPLFAGYVETLLNFAAEAARSGRTLVIEGDSAINLTVVALKKSGMDIRDLIKQSVGLDLDIIDGRDPRAALLPPGKALVIAGGGQGEDGAPATLMSQGTHPRVTVGADDVIVAPVAPVPARPEPCLAMQQGLAARAGEFYGHKDTTIISQTHGYAIDAARIMRTVRPAHVCPCHGDASPRLSSIVEIAGKLGIPASAPRNGQEVRVRRGRAPRISPGAGEKVLAVHGQGPDAEIRPLPMKDGRPAPRPPQPGGAARGPGHRE